jgi:hypothetical protein
MTCCLSFAYSDYAIARAIERRPVKGLSIDISYDSACSYSKHFKERFKTHLNHLYDDISDVRFTIDALHVQDHTDRCTYLYSASYKIGIGRNAGIGAEQYWAENNQLGPQTRQMNRGHRQDKITEHHGEWNWKKTGRMGEHLHT